MTAGQMSSKLIRMAHLPWGAFFFVGGLLLVYATDVPDAVGWATVAVGAFLILMQILAFVFVATVLKRIDSKVDIKSLTANNYTTNFGRRLPKGPNVQRTTMKGVVSDGDVNVRQKQGR